MVAHLLLLSSDFMMRVFFQLLIAIIVTTLLVEEGEEDRAIQSSPLKFSNVAAPSKLFSGGGGCMGWGWGLAL